MSKSFYMSLGALTFDGTPHTFDFYEVSTVREFTFPNSDGPMMLRCDDDDDCADDTPNASGPVRYGVYGHILNAGVVWIADFESLRYALDLVVKVGGISRKRMDQILEARPE